MDAKRKGIQIVPRNRLANDLAQVQRAEREMRTVLAQAFGETDPDPKRLAKLADGRYNQARSKPKSQ